MQDISGRFSWKVIPGILFEPIKLLILLLFLEYLEKFKDISCFHFWIRSSSNFLPLDAVRRRMRMLRKLRTVQLKRIKSIVDRVSPKKEKKGGRKIQVIRAVDSVRLLFICLFSIYIELVFDNFGRLLN